MTAAKYGKGVKTVLVRVPANRKEDVEQYLLKGKKHTQCNSYPFEVDDSVTVMLDKIKEFAPPSEICDGVNRIVWWIEAELMPIVNKADAIHQQEMRKEQQKLFDEYKL